MEEMVSKASHWNHGFVNNHLSSVKLKGNLVFMLLPTAHLTITVDDILNLAFDWSKVKISTENLPF